ncbi:hypothetical protein JCM10450v2_008177 [Rhodotorula kratochvilovae]
MAPLDLLLLGTATSSGLPAVTCLTDPEKGCHCCRSTLDKSDKDAQKNVRRNTSAVLRIPPANEGDRERTILIDCGKTFYSGAIEHWPAKNLREIDAVLLTHAHADAILGLDDLRGWTLRGAIQASIPIYLTQETFGEVSRAFPYLTNLGKATGGGDVPALTWHIFDENEPFELFGVKITPLPVHHGKFFTTPPSPYTCLGFLFSTSIAYLSDVSYIPPAVWTTIERTLGGATLDALIVDCLRIEPFTSHYGVGQAVQTARRLGARRNYLIGFGHRTSHALWLALCEALSTSPPTRSPLRIPEGEQVPTAPHQWELYNGSPVPTAEDAAVFVARGLQAVEAWEAASSEEEKAGTGEVWIRPGVDGMTLRVGGGRRRGDDEYGYEG